MMASDKLTLEFDGELIEFEITEWTGEIELPPPSDPSWIEMTGFTAVTLILLPAGCAGLN